MRRLFILLAIATVVHGATVAKVGVLEDLHKVEAPKLVLTLQTAGDEQASRCIPVEMSRCNGLTYWSRALTPGVHWKVVETPWIRFISRKSSFWTFSDGDWIELKSNDFSRSSISPEVKGELTPAPAPDEPKPLELPEFKPW